MPHYKCVACKTRLYSAARPPDLVGDLCPQCGSLLEPVAELAEVVGFRSITSRDGAADAGALSTRERLSDRLGDLIAHREARLAEARLDALDGELRVEAVALPRPETSP
ncbi:MAG: hypothetical protein LC790_11150 [Actinobacteria bacterium]|nr:hypothetical protein [Actinomycetota bacterium]